jgi:hypothetical protein
MEPLFPILHLVSFWIAIFSMRIFGQQLVFFRSGKARVVEEYRVDIHYLKWVNYFFLLVGLSVFFVLVFGTMIYTSWDPSKSTVIGLLFFSFQVEQAVFAMFSGVYPTMRDRNLDSFIYGDPYAIRVFAGKQFIIICSLAAIFILTD